MKLHGASLGLAMAALPGSIFAQVSTVTEYASACKSIYTTMSNSVTVVQSTVFVSPTPLTDAALNAGAAFVLQIQAGAPEPGSRKRQAESATYLTASGYTTTDASQAVQYMIKTGTLISTAGGWISTNYDVPNEPFAISQTLGAISTEFYFQNLDLHWTNDSFDGGAAEFFTVPVGNGGQQVIVRFNGSLDARWVPVTLVARSSSGLPVQPSGGSGGSTSVSTIISMGSMTIPYTSTTVASPSPSSNVSPDGVCGGTSGFNCYGADSGNCCSQYGFCGQGPEFCDTGCQVGFGDCNPVSSSSVVATSSIASSATPSASPSSHVNPEGICGGTSGFNCYGVPSGNCCGPYGYCGQGAGYCDSGCQVGFGECDRVASSSVAGPSMISTLLSTSPTGDVSGSNSATSSVVSMPSSSSSSYTSLSTYSVPGQPIGPVGPISSSQGVVVPPYSTLTASSNAPWITTSWTQTLTSNGMTIVVPPASYSSMALSATSSIASAISSISSAQAYTIMGSGTSSSSGVMSSSSVGSASTSKLASFTVSSGYSSSTAATVVPTSASSSSSATSAAPTAICPAGDRTAVTDSQGTQYEIGCGEDTTGNLVSITQTIYNVTECMTACDSAAGCLGFTWVGAGTAVNGQGAGNCYLKGSPSPLQFDHSGGLDNHKVSGIRLNPPGQSSSSTITPASSSSMDVSTATSISTQLSASMSTTPTPSPPSTSSSSSPIDSSSTSNYLVIPSPTPCDFGDPPNTDEDDSYCEVDLPQAMHMYAHSDTQTFPCTNGFLSITEGSIDYEAQPFPDANLPASTVAPLFDDWYIYGFSAPQQGIWYSLDAQGVWYEYYVARAGQMADVMHFTVRYDYARPGVFTYAYYDLSGEDGEFASVGMQGVNATGQPQGFTYSFQTADITPGLKVTCDTNANICTVPASG